MKIELNKRQARAIMGALSNSAMERYRKAQESEDGNEKTQLYDESTFRNDLAALILSAYDQERLRAED